MSNNIENKTPAEASAANSHIFHPVSGIIILLLDYLFFVVEIFPLTMPIACILSFLICFVLLFLVQKHKAGDKTMACLAKAFAGAFVTALPTPITGTIAGSAILLLSGLRR